MARRPLGDLLFGLGPFGRPLHVPCLVAPWNLVMVLEVPPKHLDLFRAERTLFLDLTLPEI